MAKNKATYHASKAWNWLVSDDFDNGEYYTPQKEATFRKPEGELWKQLASVLEAGKRRPISREMQPLFLRELLDDFEGFCEQQTLRVLKSDDNTAGISASNLKAAVDYNLREARRVVVPLRRDKDGDEKATTHEGEPDTGEKPDQTTDPPLRLQKDAKSWR